MTILRTYCRWVFLTALAIAAGCQKTSVPQPPADQEAKIERLIDALAAKPESLMKNHPQSSIPGQHGERSPADTKIAEAAEKLVEEGLVAFPQLAKHIEDQRYSFTFWGGNGDRKLSVGSVCSRIMSYQVDAWDDCIELFGGNPPGYRPYIASDKDFKKKDMERWVEDRKGKTLNQLQMEATERAREWLTETKGKVFRLHVTLENT